jgi:hypothetical protein
MSDSSCEPYHFFVIIIELIFYFMNYICQILKDEQNLVKINHLRIHLIN